MGHSLQSKTARYVTAFASINNREEEKCFVDSNDATRNSMLEVFESRGSMIALFEFRATVNLHLTGALYHPLFFNSILFVCLKNGSIRVILFILDC